MALRRKTSRSYDRDGTERFFEIGLEVAVSTDLVVIAAGVTLTAFLWWFFFGPKRARSARVASGVQEVTVTVKGGYSPSVIRVQTRRAAATHVRSARGR